MIERVLLLALFLCGFCGLAVSRNLIKKVYALAIMNTSVILFFIVEGAAIGSLAPLLQTAEETASFVDPIPQALMLTAIVVGVCVSALSLALVYRLYRVYGTLDCEELRKMIGHD
ncbi:sodium:proton antiporter [Breznakiella homolactica]|uniref:Cation:proton antiporter subunit C n=1 Tax=Breznakiella homolactica TaxID=2798577 RepID=A0A7T8BBW4_9SPIR|nr:cation:proton antiporter subunit C [Breznakiella homolactica]QQO10997.1 cation:proton antiporter subunit C [Breznakiella homolactica]